MNKVLYPKLALSNINRNNKVYIPYMITCICTIIMFYNMYSLSLDKGITSIQGAESVQSMLSFGTQVIGIFSAVFLFYTNSFLIKRRKKELGLYQILGMEKKHLAKVLFFETVFLFLISIFIGLGVGIAFNKLMYLLLLRFLGFSVGFEFTIPLSAVFTTFWLFALLFLVLLFANLVQIHMSNPIHLLQGGQVGEKEPKTNWLFTIIGILFLGLGYGISILVKSPLQAISLFFIAVVAVMIGTYALFISGSITFLKLLRKNKKFYYQTKHFVSVSGMLYRMKQNAVGLANICILSCAVLVMLSTTFCLYIGKEDLLNSIYPNDVAITLFQNSQKQSDTIHNYILDTAKDKKVVIEDFIDYRAIHSLSMVMLDKNNLSTEESLFSSDRLDEVCNVTMIPVEQYNKMNPQIYHLKHDEILFYSSIPFEKDTLILNNKEYKIQEQLKTFPGKLKLNSAAISFQTSYVIVMPDEIEMKPYLLEESENGYLDYQALFNISGDRKDILQYTQQLEEKCRSLDDNIYIQNRYAMDEMFYALYGGLFFLGIFLGLLFLMATVLIIYYKQVSEGYDDRERFSIMQKIGMSKKEIQQSIHSQILLIFFIPLFTAIIHISVAFPVLTKLLSLMYLTNVSLFLACMVGTISIFTIIYIIIYSLTARVYYKIVESNPQ